YIGTRFIASTESLADEAYKQMLVQAHAQDILYTPFFTGIPGNYLKPSIAAAGLDPDNLPAPDTDRTNFGTSRSKPWRDIWGAGQGVGSIDSVLPVQHLVAQLKAEYQQAHASLNDPFPVGAQSPCQ